MRKTLFGLLALVLGFALAQAPKVDGKIAGGEYAKSYKHEKSGFTLYWSVVGDTLYLALEGESKGWIGVGSWRKRATRRRAPTSTSFTWKGASPWPWTCTRPSAPGPPWPTRKRGERTPFWPSPPPTREASGPWSLAAS